MQTSHLLPCIPACQKFENVPRLVSSCSGRRLGSATDRTWWCQKWASVRPRVRQRMASQQYSGERRATPCAIVFRSPRIAWWYTPCSHGEA